MVACPNGCGVGILQQHVDYHNFMQCPKFKPSCPRCKTCYEHADDESILKHDCFEAVREELEKLRAGELPKNPSSGGSHGDEYVKGFNIKAVKCPLCGKKLRKCSALQHRECDQCLLDIPDNELFFFNCHDCDYDVCFPCCLKEQRLLNEIVEASPYPY